MSVTRMLVVMAAGTALVMIVGRRSETHHVPAPKPPVVDDQWLSPEAASELIRTGGAPGPLFDRLQLGGLAPSADVRDTIASFARAHHVEIDLEAREGMLSAIRLSVTYGGCCGYEGADVLALKLGRPSTGNCCVCGPDTWINDWALVTENGVHLRASVRVNRVTVRWESTMTVGDLIDRADELLGKPMTAAAREAGDRWKQIEPHRFLIEAPYREANTYSRASTEFGFEVDVRSDRVAEVTLPFVSSDDEPVKQLKKELRARWGRPPGPSHTWTWHRADRTMVAEFASYPPKLTIKSR